SGALVVPQFAQHPEKPLMTISSGLAGLMAMLFSPSPNCSVLRRFGSVLLTTASRRSTPPGGGSAEATGARVTTTGATNRTARTQRRSIILPLPADRLPQPVSGPPAAAT